MTHLLAPIDTTPSVHCSEATHETAVPKIEDSSITDVGETAKVEVTERLRDGLVGEGYIVCDEDVALPREFT